MNNLPYTTWNIDEVIADIISTAASQFPPDNWSKTKEAAIDIREHFKYFVAEGYVYDAAELLDSAKGGLDEFGEVFMNISTCPDDFDDDEGTRSDALFLNYAIVLFYKRLISDGLTPISPAPAGEPPPVATVKQSAGTRGPYQNPRQEQALKRYEGEVRDAIAKAIRDGKEPDRAKIERPILRWLIENRDYKERTLRKHLPKSLKEELFGKIYRQVSETIQLTDR